MKNALLIAILVIASFFSGMIVEHKRIKPQEPIIKEYHDTTFVDVVKTEIKPIYVTKRVVDTLRVPYVVNNTDTLYLPLPKEEKVYEDSLYRAIVSGYEPSLDEISIYSKTKVVDHYIESVTKCRWGIGVQAGYGASKDGLTPYVGVGLHYNILSW